MYPDMDTLVYKSIAIGNALYFRDILHEALRQVVEEKAPFIYDAVSTMFQEYKRNTYLNPELVATDALANDVGLVLGTSDQPLKRALTRVFTASEAPLVALLPYLYAGAFYSTPWREAQYRPMIEGL